MSDDEGDRHGHMAERTGFGDDEAEIVHADDAQGLAPGDVARLRQKAS
jgi:hypothetical protein